ncbi:MAG TPA: hypothetical protein VIQ78_01630 [Terrimesophilobacter sp.]|jgi:hypothetical protein|uniref:hypothetical protein n=1 Tax=Terrimesophilobacter sp. TaxID=2906435 RepID=UPI002F95C5DC
MLLLAVLAAEEHAPLVMPNWAFALTAFIIFVLLGFVTWSFRDVANRHSHRVAADGSASTGPGEPANH